MEKFLDELILSERKKRKEKVLDEQIDLERDCLLYTSPSPRD